MNSKKAFAFLRIAFGVVWGVDAYFKWNSAFQTQLAGYFNNVLPGQPSAIAAWITFWLVAVSHHPHFFALLVAILESALAISLIFGLGTRVAIVGGVVFSFLLWSAPEGFGGPYMPGMSDVGASIIYIFVFAALWFGQTWQAYSLDVVLAQRYPKLALFGKKESAQTSSSGNRWMIEAVLGVVIVLLAVVGSEYFPSSSSQNVGVGSTAPMGMTVTTYPVDPSSSIPTVDFTITQDPTSMGGWDIHIVTTNFTFTPQNVNQPPVPNEGHVHLYVDQTLSVVYGPWYHLDDLTPGQHTITVTLAANNHSIFSLNGNYIQAQKVIVQN